MNLANRTADFTWGKYPEIAKILPQIDRIQTQMALAVLRDSVAGRLPSTIERPEPSIIAETSLVKTPSAEELDKYRVPEEPATQNGHIKSVEKPKVQTSGNHDLLEMFGLDKLSSADVFFEALNSVDLEDKKRTPMLGKAKEYEVWDFLPDEVETNFAKRRLSDHIFALGTQMRAFFEALGAPHVENPQHQQNGIVLFKAYDHTRKPAEYLKEMQATLRLIREEYIGLDQIYSDSALNKITGGVFGAVLSYTLFDYTKEFVTRLDAADSDREKIRIRDRFEQMVSSLAKAMDQFETSHTPENKVRTRDVRHEWHRTGWVLRENEQGESDFVEVTGFKDDQGRTKAGRELYEQHLKDRNLVLPSGKKNGIAK